MTKKFAMLLLSTSMFISAKSENCQPYTNPALESLYNDKEIKNYVCGFENDCDLKDFTSRLDIQKIRLRSSAKMDDGITVEPKRKGLQYFTAVYHKENCSYHLVLHPDTSLAGLKILKESRNGFFIIKTYENKSREEWEETKHIYDPSKQVYKENKSTCYIADDTQKRTIPCRQIN